MTQFVMFWLFVLLYFFIGMCIVAGIVLVNGLASEIHEDEEAIMWACILIWPCIIIVGLCFSISGVPRHIINFVIKQLRKIVK